MPSADLRDVLARLANAYDLKAGSWLAKVQRQMLIAAYMDDTPRKFAQDLAGILGIELAAESIQ